MLKKKTMICAMISSLAVVACSSHKQTMQPVSAPNPQYQAPAAWAMQPASNSLQKLDKTFSISAPELSTTRQN